MLIMRAFHVTNPFQGAMWLFRPHSALLRSISIQLASRRNRVILGAAMWLYDRFIANPSHGEVVLLYFERTVLECNVAI